MKRVIKSLLILIFVFPVFVMSTVSAYVDSELLTETFVAGTIDIAINNENPFVDVGPFNFSDIAPFDAGAGADLYENVRSFDVENLSTFGVNRLTIALNNVENNENSCLEPELDVTLLGGGIDGSCGSGIGSNQGELLPKLKLRFSTIASCPSVPDTYVEGLASEFLTPIDFAPNLSGGVLEEPFNGNPGEVETIYMCYRLDSEVSNIIMSDSLSFFLRFNAQQ